MITLGLIGNPNCGKTTLFNALTGTRQRVGNWPGVTVEKKIGTFQTSHQTLQLVDLPGTYSLSSTSPDEKITQDYLLSGEAHLVLNILDSSNLERNLYLTSQLLEMELPVIVVANMVDVAHEKQIEIHFKKLEMLLGCPVIPVVASKGSGLIALKQAIDLFQKNPASNTRWHYTLPIEEAILGIVDAIDHSVTSRATGAHSRWNALKLLEEMPQDDLILAAEVKAKIGLIRYDLSKKLEDEIDIVIADQRFGKIHQITSETVKKKTELSQTLSDRIDRVVLSRFAGIPIFLLAMYLTFTLTINFGGAFIDFFDQFVGAFAVDGLHALLTQWNFPQWLTTLLANGVGGGIQTVATFIPPIGLMFLCLSVLEDSGYMARAAFVMDRMMRLIGLPGKAIIPLIVGFGCNVPAIMASRTLEAKKDRTLTIMMAPFMSCGARLPIYALFAAAFFPHQGQNLVFSLYLIGITLAILTGVLLKKTLLMGEATPFIMELPPYHIPHLKTVLLQTWDRLKSFLFRAGKLIVSVVVVLSFLNSLGTDGSFGNENKETSVLSLIGKKLTPLFAPMGIRQENWPATVGIFTGVFAKEAVVGTLDALYSTIGQGDINELPFDLKTAVRASLQTIPDGLSKMLGQLQDPLGLNIADVKDLESASASQEVSIGTFGAMVQRFDGKIGAFAYLLFILLYFPCVSATAAVYRETNLTWTLFIGIYTTVLAWMAGTLCYQIVNYTLNPQISLMWIGGILSFLLVFVIVLKGVGNYQQKQI